MNLGPVPHVDSSRPLTTSLTRLSLLPSFPQRSAETEHFLVFLYARTVLYTHSEKNSTKVYRYAVICGHCGLSLKEIAVCYSSWDFYWYWGMMSTCYELYWHRKMMSYITTWHSGRRVIDSQVFPHYSHWRNDSTPCRNHPWLWCEGNECRGSSMSVAVDKWSLVECAKTPDGDNSLSHDSLYIRFDLV